MSTDIAGEAVKKWGKELFWSLLQPLLRKLGKKLAVQIPIFGLGGTGKSALANYFSQPKNRSVVGTDYKVSWSKEERWLDNSLRYLFVALPGQAIRRDVAWPAFVRRIVDGKIKLLINVVCHGYHSLDGGTPSYKDHVIYKKRNGKMGKRQFLDAYLKKMRSDELSVFAQLTAQLRAAMPKRGQPVRMVTVITKQDLWWDKSKEVEAYYREGEYNNHVAKLREQLGNALFQHELVSTSLIISPFRTAAGEVLSATKRGYDQAMQMASLKDLFERIVELLESA